MHRSDPPRDLPSSLATNRSREGKKRTGRRRKPGRSSNLQYREGFTLVGILVTIAILAALVGIASHYYGQIQQDTLVTRTRSELVHYRDQLRIYRMSHPTSIVTSFGDFILDTANLYDPWGSAYILDTTGCRIMSLGPDKLLDPPGMDWPNDVVEVIPPNPTPEVAIPHSDLASPLITDVGPTGVVTTRRPQLRARFTDAGTGIDPASTTIAITGKGSTGVSDSKRNAGALTVIPTGDLPDGIYRITVMVKDKAGNAISRQWDIRVVGN